MARFDNPRHPFNRHLITNPTEPEQGEPAPLTQSDLDAISAQQDRDSAMLNARAVLAQQADPGQPDPPVSDVLNATATILMSTESL